MKRKKTIVASLLLAAFAGCWIAGPPPFETGVYIQSVTQEGAVIAMVDRSRRRLRARVWRFGDPENRRVVVEDTAVLEHAIAVTGLAPATSYEFELLEEQVVVATGSFGTAPSTDLAPVRFAAVGDSGDLPWWWNMHKLGWSRARPLLAWTETPQQWSIAQWIEAQKPDFFVHLGDIVYWRELRAAHEEAFFRPFAGLLETTPLFSMVGNHDIPRDGSEPPFERVFHNPSPAKVGRRSRNYSIAWGSVRVIVLDVVDPLWQTGATRMWLEKTLRTASEPWLIVATHLPCFSVYAKRTESPELRDGLWKLLTRYGVDLVLSGDDHHFVRFKPTAPDSPIQVTVGGGGKSLYDVKPDDRIAKSAKAWGFALVEAEGLVLRVQVLGKPGTVLDEFTIDRRTGPLPETMRLIRKTRIEGLR